MIYGIEAIKQLVRTLQIEQNQLMRELSKMPPGRLYQEKRGDNTFYYQRQSGANGIVRLGISKHTKFVYQLARKEFLITMVKNQRSAKLWADLFSNKIDFEVWEKSIEQVSKKFPSIPRGAFLLGAQYESNAKQICAMFPNGTIHRTQGGIWVRSKSELIIAEILESFGIPYQYEVDLPCDEYHLCPDFTVVRPRDGKVVYWEHFGMTHDEEYLHKMDLKLVRYRRMNIKPWDNLMISYDREDGSLDLGIIRSMIDSWLR